LSSAIIFKSSEVFAKSMYVGLTLPPINFIMDIQHVVPAGIAGIQEPRMASSNHILVTWIPAVHAGMTCYFYGYE
jgi:hypothetical protein